MTDKMRSWNILDWFDSFSILLLQALTPLFKYDISIIAIAVAMVLLYYRIYSGGNH